MYNYLWSKYLRFGRAVKPTVDHAGNDHLHNLDGGRQGEQHLRDQPHEEEEELPRHQKLFESYQTGRVLAHLFVVCKFVIYCQKYQLGTIP